MENTKKRRLSQARHSIALIKIAAFVGFLVLMGFIGLLWFARPSESVWEKRELTKFPTLTLEGLWDGSFFSGKTEVVSAGNDAEGESPVGKQVVRVPGVDTWYADTYPLRELLFSYYSNFRSLYGFQSEQMVGSGKQGDEIPTGEVDLASLAGRDRDTELPTQSASGEPGESTETTENVTASTENTEPAAGAGDVTTPGEQAGTIYITENCGYGVYYFDQSGSARYCLAVNAVAEAVKGKAQVYSLIGPISAGIMLSDEIRDKVGGSDESEALRWMYGNMDPSVKAVNVYNVLKQHNNEYIYYHTDHHWTALGAYYAYTEFCRQKGITPHQLSEFETMEFPNFLGTFYTSSYQSPALAANPDTVTAYIPNGTNDMIMYSDYGSSGGYTKYDWKIIYDVSSYPQNGLYGTFCGGDQPFNYAHNPQITDGSTVLIVKDSYGNAFIPFLVDHYEHIYWIDYRAYQKYCMWSGTADASISAFVTEHQVNDVILLNNINSTGASDLLSKMEQIFK